MAKLSWKKHDSHRDILKEFYGLNKYLITEQFKDTLLDAIECMKYVIEQLLVKWVIVTQTEEL